MCKEAEVNCLIDSVPKKGTPVPAKLILFCSMEYGILVTLHSVNEMQCMTFLVHYIMLWTGGQVCTKDGYRVC
jgi:hypothetical protein